LTVAPKDENQVAEGSKSHTTCERKLSQIIDTFRSHCRDP
jgi:hypothetical protein